MKSAIFFFISECIFSKLLNFIYRMKNIFLIVLAISTVVFSSCNQQKSKKADVKTELVNQTYKQTTNIAPKTAQNEFVLISAEIAAPTLEDCNTPNVLPSYELMNFS